MNPNFGNQGFRQQALPGQMMMPNGPPMMPQSQGQFMNPGQGQFMNPGQGHYMGTSPGPMMMGATPMMGVRMRPSGAPPSYNQALNQSMQHRPRNQQANPNLGKTEEQIQREKHFQQQQVKLKQFGKTGATTLPGATTLDPNKLVDSIFGSSQSPPKPKQHQKHIEAHDRPKQQQQQQQPATIDTDDGFGDFLSSPDNMPASVPQLQSVQSTPPPSTQQTEGLISHSEADRTDRSSQPITMATQIPVNTERKDLTKMMIDSCDLTAPQKAKLFHKPSLKEINPIHASAPQHHTSNNARRWTQSEDLSQLFLQEAVKDEHVVPKKPAKHVSPTSKHPPKPPPWFNDSTLIPAVYKQVYEACLVGSEISTERLYPILMLSGLPKEMMGQLWTLCNKTTPGQLIEKELYQLLAVIALTQNNFKVETLDILYRCPKAPVPFLAPAGTPVPPQSPIQMTPTSPTQLPGEMVPHIIPGMVQSPPASSQVPVPITAQIPGQATGPVPITAQIPGQAIGPTTSCAGPSQLPQQTGFSPGPVPPMVVGAVPTSTSAAGNFPVCPNNLQGASPYASHVTGCQATMMTSPMTSSLATLPVTQLPTAGLSPGVPGNIVPNEDDDFADFQAAALSPPMSGMENSVIKDPGVLRPPSRKETNNLKQVSDIGVKKSTANISHDLKHSTVENFFGSDDSSGSNSPDDDYYDGYKSADSKPSDSTSQFSTDQSEGEDFRNFENYLDEFQRKKDMQDKESPLHRPISKFLGKTKSPPSPVTRFPKQPAAINKLPLPIQVKITANQNPASSDEFSDFADFQSAPANETTNQVAGKPDLLKASSSAIDLIGDEDKYAALRSLDFSSVPEEQPQSDIIGEPETDVKPPSDSDENWADFQTASNDVPDLDKSQNSNPVVSQDIPTVTNTVTSLPVADESDWAAFGAAGDGSQANKQWSGSGFESTPGLVPKVSLFEASNVISARVEVADISDNIQEEKADNPNDWAEFQEGTDDFSDFQSSTKDTLPKSDDIKTGLVNIKREKLDTTEILGLFKVKSDPMSVSVSRDDDHVSSLANTNISLSSDMNKLHGIQDTVIHTENHTQDKPVPDIVKQKHMSEEDDFMKPPPMDNFHDDEHEDFGTFSRGYDDIDDIVKPKVPKKKNVYGVYGLNENFVVSGHKKDVMDVGDSKNITIEVTKDSDVDNDTDSVSSKDNDVYRGKFGLGNVVAEDSQSVASLELVSNKSLQNVRDAEGNDNHSVSSNEFGNFEIGVNKDILAESKSLDSLDLRQEDGGETGSSLDNSDKDSKEETPPRDQEDYTKPVFDLQSCSGLPVIGDRYSSIMHDVQGGDKYAVEWQRCLDNCCRMIQDANNTFNSISSSSVCNEVIKSAQGAVYIQGVIEIYKIVCKISTTMNKSGIHSDKLTQLLKNIDLAWNNLTAFLVGGSVMPDEKNLMFGHGTLLSDDTASQYKACGVCLLNVEMNTSGGDMEDDNAKLTYGRRQYHTSCANFWINCVDSTLPALKLPELL